MARLFLICVFVAVIPEAQLQNRTRTCKFIYQKSYMYNELSVGSILCFLNNGQDVLR